MRTVTDMIVSVREILQDEEDLPYRYSDASLVSLLNDAVQEVRNVRPDAFIGTFDTVTAEYVVSDIAAATPIAIPTNLLPSMRNYISGMAELRDAEYSIDGRAATLVTDFRNRLRTG